MNNSVLLLLLFALRLKKTRGSTEALKWGQWNKECMHACIHSFIHLVGLARAYGVSGQRGSWEHSQRTHKMTLGKVSPSTHRRSC